MWKGMKGKEDDIEEEKSEGSGELRGLRVGRYEQVWGKGV